MTIRRIAALACAMLCGAPAARAQGPARSASVGAMAGGAPRGATTLPAGAGAPTPLRSGAGDRYYLVYFSSQATPRFNRIHTFATVVKTAPDAQWPGGLSVEIATISLMPASHTVNPLNPFSEAAVNLDLAATLSVVQGQGQRVSAWGPFEITAATFGEFAAQKRRLETEPTRYRALDPLSASSPITNCIHAVSDADPELGRAAFPSVLYGDLAAYNLVRRLSARNVIVEPGADHAWLLTRLGLGGRGVVRQAYQSSGGPLSLDWEWPVRAVTPLPAAGDAGYGVAP